jgi:hypothetical protein
MAKLGDTTVYGSVNAQGIVSRPKQPGFGAVLGTSQYITVSVTWQTIVGWNKIFDNNNNFDLTTGIFTAPVTGKYQFSTNVDLRALDSAASYYWIRINAAAEGYGCLLDPNFTADVNYRGFSVGLLSAMNAGDEAYVAMYQNSGTLSQTFANVSYTSFSGYLVC